MKRNLTLGIFIALINIGVMAAFVVLGAKTLEPHGLREGLLVASPSVVILSVMSIVMIVLLSDALIELWQLVSLLVALVSFVVTTPVVLQDARYILSSLVVGILPIATGVVLTMLVVRAVDAVDARTANNRD